MFNEILQNHFYGNSVSNWLTAGLFIVITLVCSKLLYWMIANVVKSLTSRTKTKLDDLLIDSLQKPVVLAVNLIGIWYSVHYLELSKDLTVWIGRAYYLLIIFDIAWCLTRVFDALVEEYLVPAAQKTEGHLDDQLLPLVKKGIKVVIWCVALVVGLNNAGYDVGAIIAGLGVGGLAFALAAQDSIANLFGGVTVILDKPFKINDRIVIDGLDGFVREIGLRSTRLETLQGRIITIPNKSFSGKNIENITSEPSRKITTKLGLTYQTPVEKIERAMELAKNIVLDSQNTDNNPTVCLEKLNDYSLDITLVYFILKDKDIPTAQSEVNLAILKAFAAEKIEIAYPTRTVFNANV